MSQIPRNVSICSSDPKLRKVEVNVIFLRFQESAMSYVRMTNEAKDLRSALLLEQAAYCYLMCNPPLVRKYAFHIILSGYRFSKSGQKKHSSRAYRQGFQVYLVIDRFIFDSFLDLEIFSGLQRSGLGPVRKPHPVHPWPSKSSAQGSLHCR